MFSTILSEHELRGWMLWANEQTREAIIDCRKLEAGRNDLGFDTTVLGVLGEVIVHKIRNQYCAPAIKKLDKFEGDCGRDQIRTVRGRDFCLLIKPDDLDDRDYYLVLIEGLRERKEIKGSILGYMNAAEAKRRYPLEKRGAAHLLSHYVPQADLYPFTP